MINVETIRITPEILTLIFEIEEFKGAWRALGTLAPERLRALRRIATIESIGSSTRIEGSKLSDREIERRLAVKMEREKNTLAILSELSVKILDHAREQGRVATRDMVLETGASPNTLKATFSALVKKGLLVRQGGGRSTWYRLP